MYWVRRGVSAVTIALIILIIGFNLYFYWSLYEEQVKIRETVLARQVKGCGGQIESNIEEFQNDLSFFFSNEDVGALFRERNMYNPVMNRIRTFYIKYNELVNEIKIFDTTGQCFTFFGTPDNYYQNSFSQISKPVILAVDSFYIDRNKELHYTSVLVKDRKPYANINFRIDLARYISTVFNQYYLKDQIFQALSDTRGEILTNNLNENGIQFSQSGLIRKDLSENLSGIVRQYVYTGETKDAIISAYYPINILGTHYGILFSEKTNLIIDMVLNRAGVISFLTILLFLIIVGVFQYFLFRLKRNEQVLTTTNEELERIATITSHDLQEPLRKIQLFSDRIKTKHMEQFDESSRLFLERIEQSAKRMQALLSDLIRYSSVNEKQNLFTTVDLDQILRDVIGNLKSEIESSNAEISKMPFPAIQGNAQQLQTLFENLIENSIRYRRTAMPLMIRLTSRKLTRGKIEISIEDNGIGIDPQFHERIFRPFQQIDPMRNTENTGIGLSICRKIIDMHRGKIEVSSELGTGTVIILTLPVKQKQPRKKV